jgi:hypothetical protein
MKGTIFETFSSIQQNVPRELKAIREEAFLGHLILRMGDVNVLPKQAVTILIGKKRESSSCA